MSKSDHLKAIPDIELPVTVGNPGAIEVLKIDQDQLEDYTNPEVEFSEIDCGKPPRSVYFTVRREKDEKNWKDRGYYFVLEVDGRDPYLVTPSIAKSKIDEEDTIRPVLIVRYVTMAGDEGLWILKLNPADGRENKWNTAALKIL